jgi:hypothetical protein
MLVFLINSVNAELYSEMAKYLVDQIIDRLDSESIPFHVVVVKGGSMNKHISIQEKQTVIHTKPNLYDFNAFVGFAENRFYFESEEFRNAVYVYLHDTCVLSERFATCMRTLKDLKFRESTQWIFAHTYGRHNIGVCTYDFVLKRARHFDNIAYLSKAAAVNLEQGTSVVCETIRIPSSFELSSFTLGSMIRNVDSLEEAASTTDMFSINAFEYRNTRWYMVYIASLGIYKLMHSNKSYLIPVWSSSEHQTKNEDHLKEMRNKFNKIVSSFVPLIGYSECLDCM